jgi:hypothetical protein
LDSQLTLLSASLAPSCHAQTLADRHLDLDKPILLKKGSLLCERSGNIMATDASACNSAVMLIMPNGPCTLRLVLFRVKVILSTETLLLPTGTAGVIQVILQLPASQASVAAEPVFAWVLVSDLTNDFALASVSPRVSPKIATVWSVEELVALMPEPTTKKRGTYKKRVA